jgi:hypothetical protein
VNGPTLSKIHYSTNLRLFSLFCLHQSSGNVSQRRKFPFPWVLEMSPCLNHSNSQLNNYQQIHSRFRLNLCSLFTKVVSSQPELKSTQAKNCCQKDKSNSMYYRRSVGQSVLVSATHLGPMTKFLLLPYSCGFVDVWAPFLTRGWVCSLSEL